MHGHKLAEVRLFFRREEHLAVDVRRVHRAAAEPALGVAVEALGQHLDVAAHLLFAEAVHDVHLRIHDELGAVVLDLLVDLVGQLGRRGVLLLRVGEAAEALKLHLLDELGKLGEVRFGLAREAGDQRRAQRDARDLLPDLPHQRREARTVAAAVHRLQNPARRVLQRQVDVFDDLFLFGDRVEQLVGDRVRVAVQHADPVQLLDSAQAAQQLCERIFAVQVEPVARRILRDEDQLLRAVFNERARLLLDALHRAAAVAAADQRDRAVGAAVVAALGDLEVREVARRRKLAVAAQRHLFLLREALRKAFHRAFDAGGDVAVRADAEHAVHLGQLLVDLLAVALRETSRDDELLDAALLLERRKLEDLVDRLLLRALDEAAGVDDRDVGERRVVAQFKARVFEARHQHFAVHLVFCAAQADHSHFDCHM